MIVLRIFLKIAVCAVSFWGTLRWDEPWNNVALLTGGLLAVTYQLAAEYVPYAEKRGMRKVSAFWRWLFGLNSRLDAPVRAMPKHYSLHAPDGSLLVQNKSGSIFQLIPCRHSLYFRKIWNAGSDRQSAMQKEKLLTDYARLDSHKNAGKKDFRINHADLQCITCIMQEIRWKSFRAVGTMQIKAGKQNRKFYILPECSTQQLQEMLDGLPLTISDAVSLPCPKPEQRTGMLQILRTLGRERLWYLVLRTMLYLCLILMFVTAFSYEIHRMWTVGALAADFSLWMLYLISGRRFRLGNDKASGSAFSENPSMDWPMILASLIFLVIADENYLESGRFLLITGILTAVLTLLLVLLTKENKLTILIIGLVLMGGFSGGLVTTINVMYDNSEPAAYAAQVTEKYTRSRGKSGTSFHVHLYGEEGKVYDLEIYSGLYRRLEEGDTVTVYEYDGLLGIPYAQMKEE